MFENLNLDVWTIVSAVLGIVALVAGGFWANAKGRLALVVAAGNEVVDVVEALNVALKDDKIEESEVEAIKKELTEAKNALKAVIAKQK